MLLNLLNFWKRLLGVLQKSSPVGLLVPARPVNSPDVSPSSHLPSAWKQLSFNSHKQVRVLLFRECDWRGRKLLFDSKSVKKTCVHDADKCVRKKECSVFQKTQLPKPGHYREVAENGIIYQYLRPNSDVKMLGEMIFGSVAMAFQGTGTKIHNIRSPSQLMVSLVFPIPLLESQRLKSLDSSCSLQNSCSETISRHVDKAQVSSVAHSVPVDVPARMDFQHHDDDGNKKWLSDSLQSNNSAGSIMSYPISGESTKSSFTQSGSFNSLQRRWLRNKAMSMEWGLHRHGDEMFPKDEGHLSMQRRTKLGLSIIISLEDAVGADKKRLEEFIFSHMALIEGHLARLRESVEMAYMNRQQFVQLLFKAVERLQNALQDLFTAPRLPDPVWISMMSPTSSQFHLCSRFITELSGLLEDYDTKQTNFFVSKLLTAVLMYHLAWVPTVVPPSVVTHQSCYQKRTAQWVDQLAKSHPYNPLCAQLGDLYGAVGFPPKICKTVVTGARAAILLRFLFILSYFIRCSLVYQKDQDRGLDMDDLTSVFSQLGEFTRDDMAEVLSHPDTKATTEEKLSGFDVKDSNCCRGLLVNGHDLSSGTSGASQKTICNSAKERNSRQLLCDGLHCTKPTKTCTCNRLVNGLKSTVVPSQEAIFMSGERSVHCGTMAGAMTGKIPTLNELDSHCENNDSLGYASIDLLNSADSAVRASPDPANILWEEAPNNSKCCQIHDSRCSVNSVVPASVSTETKREVGETRAYIREYNSLRFAPERNRRLVNEYIKDGLFQLEDRQPDISVYKIACAKEHFVSTGPSTNSERDFLFAESSEEGYHSMEDGNCHGTCALADVLKRQDSMDLKNIMELPLPRTEMKEIGEDCETVTGFGRSLMAGITDHYMADFCLQGVQGHVLEATIKEDLTAIAQGKIIEEPHSEAVCILANTDHWSVKLFSSNKSGSDYVGMSSLVSGICESLLQLVHLKMPSEFCLMHLEDRLQELYYQSRTLADHMCEDGAKFSNPETAGSSLGINQSDFPLLIAIATTYRPQLAVYNR